jgi:hypothetical protein
MNNHLNNHPAALLAQRSFAIGGALVWGVVEFVALCRSRWSARRH